MKTSQSRYAGCIYFTSNALARKIEKLAIESWKQVSLSPSHGYLLMLVLENPGIQPGDIAGQLQLTPSTITRLIEKLEEKKLLVRTFEGKVTNVYPSPKGKELLPKMQQCLHHFETACNSFLTETESIKTITAMHKIADRIKE